MKLSPLHAPLHVHPPPSPPHSLTWLMSITLILLQSFTQTSDSLLHDSYDSPHVHHCACASRCGTSTRPLVTHLTHYISTCSSLRRALHRLTLYLPILTNVVCLFEESGTHFLTKFNWFQFLFFNYCLLHLITHPQEAWYT